MNYFKIVSKTQWRTHFTKYKTNCIFFFYLGYNIKGVLKKGGSVARIGITLQNKLGLVKNFRNGINFQDTEY